MTMELGDLATWLTGLATSGAWAVALITLHRGRRAREASDAERQDGERREQATKISAWHGGSRSEDIDDLVALNASDVPVYNVVVSMVFAQGAAARLGEEVQNPDDHICCAILPPGKWWVPAPGGWGGMYRHPAAEIAFTDATGLHWVRRGDGTLEELKDSPFDHFKISRPISLRTAEVVSESKK